MSIASLTEPLWSKRTDRRGSDGEKRDIHVAECFVSRIPGGRRGLEKKRRDGEDGARMKKKMELERGRTEGKGRR